MKRIRDWKMYRNPGNILMFCMTLAMFILLLYPYIRNPECSAIGF